MLFLNREKETLRLDRLITRKAAGLVALWGRRRVGKTRLLVEWCERHGGVYTVADQSSEAVQRRYFAEALAVRLPGFGETEYPDWATLLRRLSRDARAVGWRGPLVIDELPYWVSSAPQLPSILQNWIDNEARIGGLLVAVAGSSQQMMRGLLLGEQSPLFGRALEAMQLQPLEPGWIQQALGLKSAIDAIRAFAIWGGIPRYWELARHHGANLESAVDDLVLDPLGPLHREPDRLLYEEMPPAVALRPVLDVIGSGAHRVSEIAGRLNQPATSLARPLSQLCDLGLVEREIPHGASEKSGKRALYRIRDPFFRFWFAVVAPNRAMLVAAPPKMRRALFHRMQQKIFAESWEILCREAANRGNCLACEAFAKNTAYSARRWWQGNAPEWDLIATPENKGPIIVGEAKWSDTPFSTKKLEELAAVLLRRPLPPEVQGDVRHVLFIPSTAANQTVTANGVHLVDARMIIAQK